MREEEHLNLQNKFQEWFGDPVPADVPLPAEMDHYDHIARGRRKNKSANLLELLFHSFGRAVFFGSVVGFIIYILNLSFGGRFINYWLIQFLVVFLAMGIGFYNSLAKGLASKKRKK